MAWIIFKYIQITLVLSKLRIAGLEHTAGGKDIVGCRVCFAHPASQLPTSPRRFPKNQIAIK
jgi:hypothetical protein